MDVQFSYFIKCFKRIFASVESSMKCYGTITCCKASVFCIRYFWNYLYLHSGKRKLSGTFYSRGCRNRLIKSIYLKKCTAPDKLRTVHFFLKFYDFSIFYIKSYGFNFLQIISFRIIHTTTKTATKAPSNSNSVYHGADCMAYKFG